MIGQLKKKQKGKDNDYWNMIAGGIIIFPSWKIMSTKQKVN